LDVPLDAKDQVNSVISTSTQDVKGTPWLIQGGMGIAISGWPLARAVSQAGQLGMVSGTAIDSVFVRRLQDHGVDYSLQGVLDAFPLPAFVNDVVEQFATSRRSASSPYRTIPMLTHRNVQRSQDLLVLAAYVEVALAKQGHDGFVGINLLTKVQIPTVPTLFGAILAGVDYVVMGAGVPTHIPGILERLVRSQTVDVPLNIIGDASPEEIPQLHFDPSRYSPTRALQRPKFLGIVSSHVLATALSKRSSGPVDGFVVERPVAGGHNAPPRGQLTLDEEGNPEYGERDLVDYGVMSALGLPFWIGGGVTTPQDVQEAFELGASGVQVGTLFACCRESGMDPSLREQIVAAVRSDSLKVKTSIRASSTGYPFKVASAAGTISETAIYDARERKCDLGYLRDAYVKSDGSIGYRCASEPVSAYVKKGGLLEDTVGRTCLCNGLMSTCGLGQVRANGHSEPPIITIGDCVNEIGPLLIGKTSYGAADVIAHLQRRITVDSSVTLGGESVFP
jgi:NAD(P)H-dependent flavin oxidoreductase YrpB (nitropropane dioxygenase family)